MSSRPTQSGGGVKKKSDGHSSDFVWYRYWSTGNQRHYFTNTHTGETTYEPPHGLTFIDTPPKPSASASHPPPPLRRSGGPPPPSNASLKRQREERDYPEENPLAEGEREPPVKKARVVTQKQLGEVDIALDYVISPHDRDVREVALTSFVVRDGRVPRDPNAQDEHPVIPIQRNFVIKELVAFLGQLCRAQGMRGEPPSAVTRWLFVQKLVDYGDDPLIPFTDNVDAGLRHELETQVPRETAITITSKLAARARSLLVSNVVPAIATASENLSRVRAVESKEKAEFIFESTTFRLNSEHLDKLKQRYTKHTANYEEDLALFHTRVFTLLARYEALGGPGYQAAIPRSLFQLLQDKLGVTHECFASPLNCTLASFGTAFYDTDHYFGSKGSFFDLPLSHFAEGGSFEANPPFLEEPMLVMALQMEKILASTSKPLSFTIFVPGWSDTPAFYVMRDSKHNTCPQGKFLRYRKRDHKYRDGFQHRSNLEHRVAQADSFVFFLQNNAGAKKWPVDHEFVRELSVEFGSRSTGR